MLESFKNLKSGNIKLVDNNKLFPLLRWSSGSKQDLPWCNLVNRLYFRVDKNIIKSLLYIGLRDKNPYIKYPKPEKQPENKEFELKKTLSKRYYFWSEQEFNRNLSNIKYVNWEEVAMALGCDKKERKLLGLPEIKIKKQILTKQNIVKNKPKKTLFDF